jgi:hypothetical protein
MGTSNAYSRMILSAKMQNAWLDYKLGWVCWKNFAIESACRQRSIARSGATLHYFVKIDPQCNLLLRS